MEEDLEIKVTRKLVYKGSSEELDFVKNKIFTTKEEMKLYDFCFTTDIDDGDIYLDSMEIPISNMKKMLDEAEKSGANFVVIDYHCDHIEYDVYGLKIDRASATEVDEERETQLIMLEAEKEARINELELELKKLKNK